MRALWMLWTSRKTTKWVQSKSSLKLGRDENDKTEAAPLWAHHEKAGFFEKHSCTKKNRKYQEKRKTTYEMNQHHKDIIDLCLQEVSRVS